MNKTIKAVVFDVGGVLCEWRGIVKEFAREIGIEEEKLLEKFEKNSYSPTEGSDLGLITADEFFDKLAQELGVPERAKDWRRRFVAGFKRIEPTYKLVEELKDKYKLALLTNAKIGLWDEWEEGKLRENFEDIIDSSEVHILKPDKRIFKILLDRLRLTPKECLYIDDTKEYTEIAEKLGFRVIHFKEPRESVKLIRKFLYGKI